jgi:uncharacterized membrane protein YtjA (UPF0391 family)
MLRWALFFFVVSIIAGAMGFTGLAAGTAAAAKICFFIALSLFLVFLVAGLMVGKAVTR